MNVSISFRKDRLKRVPPKAIIVWIIASVLFIAFLWEICLPAYRALNNTETRDISIENIALRSNYGGVGATRKTRLTITENSTRYYIDYDMYRNYGDLVEEDLISGKVKTVTVILAGTRSLYDQLFNRYQVVEMKSDNVIYYHRDDFVKRLHNNRISAWTGFALFFLFWVVVTGYILIVYGIVELRKAKAGQKQDKRKNDSKSK